MDLEVTIRKLIESKREGNYWDFKEMPDDNKAGLLHDVVCLANSLHKGNKYLIIGVGDPEKGCEVVGLNSATPHRKKQINFIDFLRTKPFAGQIRPEVELRTITVDDREIDVLVIFDLPNKPFYLTEDYPDGRDTRRLRANHIYVRTNDSNTPIDRSADVNIIEKMWRERFGIDLSPVEKVSLLLTEPDNWFKDVGNRDYAYHKLHPEYNITFSEVEELSEPYSFFFPNEKSFFGTATFRYHSTVLFELEYLYCDEMRIHLVVPKTKDLKVAGEGNWH